MITGLREQEQGEIVRILNDYKEDYYFYFYGSRVKGNFGKNSDLDIYIVAKKDDSDYGILDQLQDTLDDNMQLLFKVNFTRDDRIDDDFRKTIKSHTIPYDWDTKKLGDVINVNPRYSIPKNKNCTFIEMKNLGTYGRKPLKIGYKNFTSGIKFKNNDTILARITPCLENGKGAFISGLKQDEIAFGSTEYIVLSEKNNLSKALYIYYLSRCKNFRDYAISNLYGTSGRQRVSADSIKEYNITIPPLEEQKAIGDILSGFDNEIENLQAQNKTIEELCKNLFKQHFTLNPNKSTWEEKTIADVVTKVIDNRGKSPPKSSYGYPLVEINAFSNNLYINISDVKKFVDENTYNNWFRSGHPQNGNILISTVGKIGETSLANNQEICIAQNIIAFNISYLYNYYTFFYLRSIKKYLQNLNISSVQPSLKVPHILKIKIRLPQEKSLTAFNKKVELLLNKISNNQEIIETLKQKRDYLLPKLIKGQVRVKNV